MRPSPSQSSSRRASPSATPTAPPAERILVPNREGVLVPSTSIMFNDAPWLASQLDTSVVAIVHARMSLRTCTLLGVRRLSQVVVEQLATRDVPRPSSSGDFLLAQRCMETVLHSTTFAHAVAALAVQERGKRGGMEGRGNSNGPDATFLRTLDKTAALATKLRKRLQTYVAWHA